MSTLLLVTSRAEYHKRGWARSVRPPPLMIVGGLILVTRVVGAGSALWRAHRKRPNRPGFRLTRRVRTETVRTGCSNGSVGTTTGRTVGTVRTGLRGIPWDPKT